MPITEFQDSALLRLYADQGRDDAFAELVARHLPLVYSAALRQLHDPDRARDICQLVFLEVARRASSLHSHPALTGWLHTTAFRLSRRSLRDDQRRSRREQEAHAMHELDRGSAPAPDAREWKAVLDEALQELRDSDRAAVILRHLEGRSLREVGASLGIGEDAARMRVQRALERLQAALARKGLLASGTTLASSLGAYGLETLPTGLASHITVAATTAATAATATATATAVPNLLVAMKASTTLTLATALLLAIPLGYQAVKLRRTEARLDELRARSPAAPATDPDAALLQREVEHLKSLQPELDRLRAEAIQLRATARQPERAAIATAREATRTAEAEAAAVREQVELRASRTFAINLLKNVGIAARIYATSHNDQIPTRLEDLTAELGGPDSPLVRALDGLELYPQPRPISEAEPQLFLARERKPRRRPDGTWERTYAFADGSIHLLHSPTEDFTPVELELGGVARPLPGADPSPSATPPHPTTP